MATDRGGARLRAEFTGEQLEEIFHAALKAGDVRGVEAALTVMVGVDAPRAIRLYGDLKDALTVIRVLNLGGDR